MKDVEAAFGRLLGVCGVISAFLVFAVAAMVALDVILRNPFGWRIPGDVEISEYCMLLTTAFAAPWLLHKGQHVRIDPVLQKIPLTAAWLSEIFGDVLGFIVSLAMTWYGVKVLMASFADGTRIVKELTIPEWWTLWPLPMMFALLAVEFVFRFRRVLSGPRRPRNEGAPI